MEAGGGASGEAATQRTHAPLQAGALAAAAMGAAWQAFCAAAGVDIGASHLQHNRSSQGAGSWGGRWGTAPLDFGSGEVEG